MRATLLALTLLASVVQPAAQQATTVPAPISRVLEKMKSPTRTERSKAFDEAAELLASDKTTPGDNDRLRLGIIQLLIAENARTNVPDEEALKQAASGASSANGTGEGEGDEWEYYPSLIDFVAHLGDERAIPALLGAAMTGGMAIRGVARFGKKALGPALEQVASGDPALASGAVYVIQKLLEWRSVSDADSHLRIKKALRRALASPEFAVRLSAMYAIEYLDDREEFVPLLKEVAEHDPVKLAGQRPDDGGDSGEFYPARFDARRLLRKIANHEQPVIHEQGLPTEEYLPVKP